MLEIVVLYMAVSLILYTIFGGADFGAGVVNMFSDPLEKRVIVKAISPVWEANHMWLILAVVILFVGFPSIYVYLTTFLHIPLIILLVGIILRGSFFAFQHYDAKKDRSQKIYEYFFNAGSLISSFMIGVLVGALFLGWFVETKGFYEAYVRPWFNGFCGMCGLFSTALFSYIANVFLFAESKNVKELTERFAYKTLISGVITFTTGLLTLIYGRYVYTRLFDRVVGTPEGALCFTLIILSIPVLAVAMSSEKYNLARIVAAGQVGLIATAVVIARIPTVVMSRFKVLTFLGNEAPESTIFYLGMALLFGTVFIIPLLLYLFKVFKYSN